MSRLLWTWMPAVVLAACGAEDYQRPRTVEYITSAILTPSCGNAQCHSGISKEANLRFDTVEDAQQGLLGLVFVSVNDQGEAEGDSSSSFLINVLTRVRNRMPYDQPLPGPDIELIRQWIDEREAIGAQCIPAAAGAPICSGSKVVDCKPDYNFGALLRDCAAMGQTCSNGACR